MIPYLACSLFIFVLGGFSNSFNKRGKQIACFFILVLLVVFAGFRGDFTIDYHNYVSIFRSIKATNWSLLFSTNGAQEIGFVLVTKILSLFCNETMYIFLISAFTLVIISITFKRMSSDYWISILLFVGIGSFYAMFNVTRMILSVAIVSLGLKHVKNGKFVKYLFIVLVGALFHTTAIIMIPMYFLLRKRITNLYMLCMILIAFLILILAPRITALASSIIPKFSTYTSDFYGMSKGSLGNAIVPFIGIVLALSIYFLIPNKKIVLQSDKNLFFNSCFFYGLFAICSLQIYMLIRFTYFFEIAIWAAIPCLLSKLSKTNAWFFKVLIVVLCLLLPLYILKDSAYNPYYFIWGN